MTSELTEVGGVTKSEVSNNINADSEHSVTDKTVDIAGGINSVTATRRFIAGAICPQCQRLDKIVVYIANAVKVVECVSCGFLQQDPMANSFNNAT